MTHDAPSGGAVTQDTGSSSQGTVPRRALVLVMPVEAIGNARGGWEVRAVVEAADAVEPGAAGVEPGDAGVEPGAAGVEPGDVVEEVSFVMLVELAEPVESVVAVVLVTDAVIMVLLVLDTVTTVVLVADPVTTVVLVLDPLLLDPLVLDPLVLVLDMMVVVLLELAVLELVVDLVLVELVVECSNSKLARAVKAHRCAHARVSPSSTVWLGLLMRSKACVGSITARVPVRMMLVQGSDSGKASLDKTLSHSCWQNSGVRVKISAGVRGNIWIPWIYSNLQPNQVA